MKIRKKPASRFVPLGDAKRLTRGTDGVGMEIATLRKDEP